MQLKDKTIISGATLVGSLVSYWYAKAALREAAPFVMIGGFVGTMLGEMVTDYVKTASDEPDGKDSDRIDRR